MKYFLKISNIKILVNSLPELRFWDNMEPFEAIFQEGEADLIYDISYIKPQYYERRFEGKLLHEVSGCKIYQNAKKYILVHRSAIKVKEGDIIVEINSDGFRHHIYIPEIYMKEKLPIYLSAVLGIDLILPYFHRIMMHTSIVKCENKAVLFTGPSGMGKSTQANLWQKYKGASIINGDRAILSVEEEVYAYGSPYAGSSGIYKNESASVKLIVLLKQGKENKMEKLVGKEAYSMLFPRFLMTKWDKKILAENLDLIEKVLNKVPVYLLTCRPDKEAVELVYQKLMKVDKISSL